MLLNILLCKLRAAARHIKKVNIALSVTMVTAPPTIPQYIPILWWVLKSKVEASSDILLTSTEQDPPSLALEFQRI